MLREPIGPAGPEGTYERFAERTAGYDGGRARHGRPRSEPNGGGGGGRALRGRRFAAIFALFRAILPFCWVVFAFILRLSFALSGPRRLGAEDSVPLGSSRGAGQRRWRGAAGAATDARRTGRGPLALPVPRRDDHPRGGGHDQPGWNKGVEPVTSPRYVADLQAPGRSCVARQSQAGTRTISRSAGSRLLKPDSLGLIHGGGPFRGASSWCWVAGSKESRYNG